MKKIAFIAVAALLLSGCKKVATCTGHFIDQNGQDWGEETIQIKEGGAVSKEDYKNLVSGYEGRGYVCTEKNQ